MNIKYTDGHTFMHIRRLISPHPPPKKTKRVKERGGRGVVLGSLPRGPAGLVDKPLSQSSQ